MSNLTGPALIVWYLRRWARWLLFRPICAVRGHHDDFFTGDTCLRCGRDYYRRWWP